MSAPSPARLIGRYLLFGEIASGGMATVHFGRLSGPAGFARTVAIKRLHPQHAKDPEFVAMFLDEARVAARIRHPNVVPTLDVVATEGEIFLVMEYVQGESLAKLRRGVKSMMTPADARIAATIMAGVLHGLHAAHEAVSEQGEPLGIVHRDVSPQNVLVGVDGTPRVLDFGVAKAVGRLQTTREGQLKGKLSYMAPEQLHNSKVTRQTDVYAASVVAWEALTGQRLFRGDNEGAVVAAVLQMPIPPPSKIAPHVPLAVDRVVLRGLERDPARRYATARDMAIDLERCVGVAASSQVGEWVESIAHDELLRRATRIAEIESVSSPSLSRPAIPALHDLPTTLTVSSAALAPPQEIRSDVSSIAVSPILPAEPRRPRGRVAMIAGVAAGAALALIGALLLMAGRSDSGGSAAASGGALTGAAAATASVTAPASAEPPLAAAPPTASDAARATAPGAAPAPAAGQEPAAAPELTPAEAEAAPPTRATPTPPQPIAHHHYAPPPPPPPQRHVAAAAQTDCDPPFTIDDKGHKHYKPACLP